MKIMLHTIKMKLRDFVVHCAAFFHNDNINMKIVAKILLNLHFKDKYIPVNVKFYDLQTEILQLIIMIFIGYYPKHEKQDN